VACPVFTPAQRQRYGQPDAAQVDFGLRLGCALFLLAIVVGATETLTVSDIVLFIIFCLLLGWILFFVFYKMTFAYFWNRRARRLRRHQE